MRGRAACLQMAYEPAVINVHPCTKTEMSPSDVCVCMKRRGKADDRCEVCVTSKATTARYGSCPVAATNSKSCKCWRAGLTDVVTVVLVVVVVGIRVGVMVVVVGRALTGQD